MQLSHLSCPLLKNVLYSNCHLRSSWLQYKVCVLVVGRSEN
jgi:hypothetical protein